MTEIETGNRPTASAPRSDLDRVMSVDVLRGFDMFWLVGGAGFMMAVVRLCGEPLRGWLLPQFEHPKWMGFTFYDTIFPLFVFVVGMSVVFSLSKLLKEQGRAAAYRRILRRAVLMFLLGLFYSGGMTNPISDIRWLGVLQRLALCYLFAGILFCHLSWRGLLAVCVAFLLGYWALLCFVPLPGHDVVLWTETDNWANYLDALFLPGRKHNGAWDPEGLLSTFPAVSTCLIGVLAAQFLLNESTAPSRKVLCLVGGGLLMAAAGALWGMQFPIIKKIWTSSYVLVAGGYSLTLLGLFYLVVDVWKIRWWTAPFIWIGMNPLTIYLVRNMVDFNKLALRFTGGSLSGSVSEDLAYFLQMTASLALSILLVRFLYRKRIFLRV